MYYRVPFGVMSTATILKSVTHSIKLTDASPEIIKAVQQQLKTIGIDNLTVDGVVGKQTAAAYAKFKKIEYLEFPDLLGKTSVEALLEATEERAAPTDNIVVPAGVKQVRLPSVGLVSGDQPIYPGSKLVWNQATKGLSRLPTAVIEVQNILKTARHLDAAIKFLGSSRCTINSWLRPRAVNKACFGASNSRHIYGDGVDFTVEGIAPYQVYDRLNEWHSKNGGLGKSSIFTHLDCRGGSAARWRYSV